MDAAGVAGVVVKPCYEKEFIMRNNLGSLSHEGRYPVGGHGSDSPPDPPNPRCRARPDSLQCTQDGQFTVSSVFAGFWSPGPTFMKPVPFHNEHRGASLARPEQTKDGGWPSIQQPMRSQQKTAPVLLAGLLGCVVAVESDR